MRRCYDESDLIAREVLRHACERRINRRGGAGIRRGTGRGNTVGSQQNALPPLVPDPILYGLRFPTVNDYYSTADDFGEPGVTTGFGSGAVFSVETLPVSITRYVFHRYFQSPNAGWTVFISTANAICAAFVNTAGSTQSATVYQLIASDLGKLFHVAIVHNGVANTWQPYLNGLPWGPPIAIVGYKPTTAKPMMLGRADANQATTGAAGTTTIGAFTFRGIPSAAAVKEHAERSRAGGYVAPNMAGVAMTHVHSPRDVLSGTGAVSGPAPAVLPDIVTSVANDALASVGSPTLVVADTTVVDGRKAYGVQGFSAANYLSTITALGIAGVATGFSVAVQIRPAKLPAESNFICGRANNANQGWELFANSAGNALAMYIWDSGGIKSITYTLPAGDIGRMGVFTLVNTGSVLRGYWRDTQVGSDVNVSGYVVFNGPMQVGQINSGSPFIFASWYGLQGGNVVWTAAQVAAISASVEATGRMTQAPGAEHWYDPTLDIIANGGPANGVPATVRDRIGTDHLTRVGTGLTVAQRVEQTWSYDASPILYGATMTAADCYESALGFAGSNAGFWTCVFFLLNAQGAAAVSTVTRTLFSCRGAGNPGWHIATNGPNGTLSFGCGGTGGAGSVTSGSFVFSANDVGKLLVAYGVWDGPALTARLYVKRAQVGTGVVFTGGTFVPESGSTFLGRRQDGFAVDNSITIFGAACGLGVPTLAEVQAHHDDVMASEQLVRGIPGKTSLRIDLKADVIANGGALPAQALDREGTAHFTRNGNPSLARQTARLWGW
jgi:hypothetical protein